MARHPRAAHQDQIDPALRSGIKSTLLTVIPFALSRCTCRTNWVDPLRTPRWRGPQLPHTSLTGMARY